MFLPKNLPGATALCKLNHVTMSGTGLRLRIDFHTKWPPIHQSDLSKTSIKSKHLYPAPGLATELTGV